MRSVRLSVHTPALEHSGLVSGPNRFSTAKPQEGALIQLIETTEGNARTADATTDVDWPVRAVEWVEKIAELARTKAIRPLAMLAKAITYAIVGLALLVTLSVVLVISLTRIITVYATGGRVWITYLVLGGIFTLAGMLIWGRRVSKKS